MHQQQRQRMIEETLDRAPVVTVDELAAKLAASPATIRRDIAAMARAGRLRRVRGGAEALAASATPGLATPSFERTLQAGFHAKRAIAAHAATLCAPGESIIVNGGTTTYCMGEHIARLGLQVLTNSFALAAYLIGNGNCRVLLPGGEVYREQSLVLSPYERDTMLDHYYAARIFTGAMAIRAQGLIEGDPLLIKAEQKLLHQAEELIVLVDGSKFAARGSLILCPLSRIGLVITDTSAPPEAVAALRDAGVRVTVVDTVEGNRDAAA